MGNIYLAQAFGGEFVVRSTQDSKEFRYSRGVEVPPDSQKEFVERVSSPKIPVQVTVDSRFVLFTINPRASGSNTDADSSDAQALTLGVVELSAGKLTTIKNITTFKVPEYSGQYLAYLRVQIAATPKQSSLHPRPSTLVLRTLASGHEVRIPDVTTFSFDGKGLYVAYAVSADSSGRPGVYVRRLRDGKVTQLVAGKGDYRSLIFDSSGNKIAFLSKPDAASGVGSQYSLYYTSSPSVAAISVVSAIDVGDLRRISPSAGVQFSGEGNALLFGIEDFKAGVSIEDAKEQAKKANFDLWDWREPDQALPDGLRQQPAIAFSAVYHISVQKWTQLSSRLIPQVLLSPDVRYVVGIAPVQYKPQDRRGDHISDVYLIDPLSGKADFWRRVRALKVAKPFGTVVALSPTGRYLTYFENRRWWSLDLQTRKLADLTGDLLPAIRFDSELSDSSPAWPPEEMGGWTAEDRRVLVYSRRDVWEIDPSGTVQPRNLTGGVGARENIVFRLWSDYGLALEHPNSFDGPMRGPDGRALNALSVDETRPVLLAAQDMDTMESGIWRTQVGTSAPPEKLIMVKKRMTPLAQSRQGTQFLVSFESFDESPDLWTGTRFDQLAKISDANPQQYEYRWGSAELVRFTSEFGVPLTGTLYKPDGFDSSKKYPMIVNIYERAWTARLHKYYSPRASTFGDDVPASPNFVSRGYLVFQPEIQPATPVPGPSALAAVRAAVQSLIDDGFVDPTRVALTGKSYGGYEVAFIVTKTDMFRCAIEGAGMTNSISAYGSVRTVSGPALYEVGSGRHGDSIWKDPFVYLMNSPVMYADRVTTPLLIKHNDADGAVPISQGLELFVALSRNAKQVYLFNYHGEGHDLVNRVNQLDWDQRVREFLDHCLLSAPAPEWMAPISVSQPASQIQNRDE